MNNLSNERLKEIASHEIGSDAYPRRVEWQAMARELLAYREAQGKPIAEIYAAPDRDDAYRLAMKKLDAAYELPKGVHQLFTAPQLPAVPEPVSNPYKLPDVLPCPVKLEPGLIIGKGCRTQTLIDAICRRAEYCAELEAMTPEQRAERDNALSDIRKLFGNSEQVNHPEVALDMVKPKDHVFREMVNALREVAKKYHNTQQLREQIAHVFFDAMPQLFADNVKISHIGDTNDTVNSPVIPDCWIDVIDRLLDCDGSRGRYHAIKCGDVHDEIERMLATSNRK